MEHVKVLLVEGESPVRSRLSSAICELGEVQVEIQDPDWPEVEQDLARSRPDVVVVDVDCPQQEGLEIIRKIRSSMGKEAPVIVAISASKSLQYRSSCHEAGATYFFNRVREQDWLLDSLGSIRDQL